MDCVYCNRPSDQWQLLVEFDLGTESEIDADHLPIRGGGLHVESIEWLDTVTDTRTQRGRRGVSRVHAVLSSLLLRSSHCRCRINFFFWNTSLRFGGAHTMLFEVHTVQYHQMAQALPFSKAFPSSAAVLTRFEANDRRALSVADWVALESIDVILDEESTWFRRLVPTMSRFISCSALSLQRAYPSEALPSTMEARDRVRRVQEVAPFLFDLVARTRSLAIGDYIARLEIHGSLSGAPRRISVQWDADKDPERLYYAYEGASPTYFTIHDPNSALWNGGTMRVLGTLLCNVYDADASIEYADTPIPDDERDMLVRNVRDQLRQIEYTR